MAAGGLKLYYDLMSQPSRAVYMFLKMNRIAFVSKPVALRKGEHLGEDFGKVTPFHLVPVIDDDGFKLTESVAILKYLADKHQTPDHWYPKDLQRRARVDSYMAWQHLNLRLNGSMVFRTKIIEPRMKNAAVDTAKLANFQAQLETTLDQVERIYLHHEPYLCGGDISLGDLLGICELMQPLSSGHDVFRDRPKLQAWASRVKERLQPHFDEAHQPIYKVQDQFGNPQAKL